MHYYPDIEVLKDNTEMQGHLLYNHKFSAFRGGFPAEKINQRRGNPAAHNLRLVVIGPHQLSETLHPNQVLRLLFGNLQLIRLDVQFEKVAPAFIGASLWLHSVTLLCRWRRLLCLFWLSLHRLLFLFALLLLEAVAPTACRRCPYTQRETSPAPHHQRSSLQTSWRIAHHCS